MISNDRAISTSRAEDVSRRTLSRSTRYSQFASNDSYDEINAIDWTMNDIRAKGRSCDCGRVRDVHGRNTEEVVNGYREEGKTKENRGTKRVT